MLDLKPIRWDVFCDFDGTIATVDVTDELLERFADPRWREIEAEWTAGLIGSQECMALQVDLLVVDRSRLDAYLDTVSIDPGFLTFVSICDSMNLPLTVLSDGMDYPIRRILQRHGLDRLPVFANRLDPKSGNRYSLTFPHLADNCEARSGLCKCRVMDARAACVGGGSRRPRRLHIGDGRSDFCAAGHADFVLAKDSLLEYCRHSSIPHLGFRDFSQVSAFLPTLFSTLASTGT